MPVPLSRADWARRFEALSLDKQLKILNDPRTPDWVQAYVTTPTDERVAHLGIEEDVEADDNAPAPPETLPSARASADAADSAASARRLSSPAPHEIFLGLGKKLADTGLSIGETLRSANDPMGVSFMLRKAGDIAADVFGAGGAGAETPDAGWSENIDAARAQLGTERHGFGEKSGAALGYIGEALATLPATPAALTRGRGFLPAAKEALGTAAREAPVVGGLTALQEGDFDASTLAATLGAGAAAPVSRALSGVRGGTSEHLANILPTDYTAVKQGGDAARGLLRSGAWGKAKTLALKLDEAANESSKATIRFLRSHPKGALPLFDRGEIAKMLKAARSKLEKDPTVEGEIKYGAAKRLESLEHEWMRRGKKKVTAEELVKLRRKWGQATSFGERDPVAASSIVTNVRQDVYSKFNKMLKSEIPEMEDLNQADFDVMLAFEGAKKLFNQRGSGLEGFAMRRGIPLAAGLAGGGIGSYTMGGDPAPAAVGLVAGLVPGSPAMSTGLAQLLKSREGLRAAEILARVFGIGTQQFEEERQ